MPKAVPALVLIIGIPLLGCAPPQHAKPPPPTHASSVEPEEESWQDDTPPLEDEAEDEDWSVGLEHDTAASSPGDASSSEEPQPSAGTTSTDEEGAGECRESAQKLSLSVDRKLVSIEEGHLEARMDGPICSLQLRVTLKDDILGFEKAYRYTGSQRTLRWDPIPRDQIEKIEVRITAEDGAYESVFLIPWSVYIEHEEVEFDTDQAVIRASEVPSLEASYAKVGEVLAQVKDKGLGRITLFIAGHTDTQGSAGHNMTLSRARARAIGNWFLQRGLCIPVAYEGFGETSLKVQTADEVDEQANRRVDYILAVEPPLTGEHTHPHWKYLSEGC